MMVKPSVTELLTKATNRYELVIATSKRARQIVQKRVDEKNAKKLAQEKEVISSSSKEKDKVKEEPAVTVAAEEIASGKVTISRKEEGE